MIYILLAVLIPIFLNILFWFLIYIVAVFYTYRYNTNDLKSRKIDKLIEIKKRYKSKYKELQNKKYYKDYKE